MAGRMHGGARALIAVLALILVGIVYFASRASPGDPASEVTEPKLAPPATPRTSAQSSLDGGAAVPPRAPIVPDAPAEIAAEEPVAKPRPRGRLPSPHKASPPQLPTEAGVIEVVVLENDAPLPAIPVAIYAADTAVAPERLEDVVEPARWSRTDARGIVRFDELAPGRYGIRAWVAPSTVLMGADDVSDGPGRRFHLRVGHGVVHGRIRDVDRVPLVDAVLELRMTPDRGHALTVATRSDVDGRFRFEGVPAGFCLLFPADRQIGQRTRPSRARFQLEPGETLEVELGPPIAPTVWTGSVRASSGEVLAFVHTVTLDDANHGNEISFRTDEHGRFRVELAPGEYIVSPEDAWGADGFLRVVVGDAPFERDLVASGVVLRVRVLPEDLARSTMLHLRVLDGSPAPVALQATSSGVAERYWRASAPRPHRLVAEGPGAIRGTPDADLDVDLTGRSGLVTIDVELVPR